MIGTSALLLIGVGKRMGGPQCRRSAAQSLRHKLQLQMTSTAQDGSGRIADVLASVSAAGGTDHSPRSRLRARCS